MFCRYVSLLRDRRCSVLLCSKAVTDGRIIYVYKKWRPIDVNLAILTHIFINNGKFSEFIVVLILI